jgi:hypothetical protein
MMLHINKVMQYVENNESTKKLKLYTKDHENNELLSTLKVLDRAYPEIDIEFIELEGVLDQKSLMNYQ